MLSAAPSTIRFATLVFLLTLVAPDAALAARPWQDPGDKPGNGNSPKWHGNAPTIQGTPASVAEVDEFYAFQPVADDKDGDKLVFSIKNKPSWAAFDTAHGYLSGFPSVSDLGLTDGIVISVSDGSNTASLPAFSIKVVQPAVNHPPQIGGNPPGEVIVDALYSFTPTATDPEGETLVFRVRNKPAWASFDTSTGRLYGVPRAADVGVYQDIRIKVSDGTSITALPWFSIAVVPSATGSVTLSWSAPTQNVDGTPLTDLSGFRVYYGTGSRQYSQTMNIANPGVTTAVIDNLSAGTWYFAATATTATGLESELSVEIQRQVQ